MSAPAELLTLVEQSGKYKVEKELFEGANAYAFIARHVHLQTTVFLKVYDVDPSDPGIFNEPRLLVDATRDPGCLNLVEVRDAERLGEDYALIAMEYVEGGSVLHRIKGEGLPQAEAVGIAIGILCGVAHLHSQEIVHRDLKPSNILLAPGALRPIPKITDFGSATKLPQPDATVRASRHSALYVPPEGWGYPSVFSRRSDLYQVGMVLHEMLNGPLPYDPADYLDAIAAGEIKRGGAKSLKDLTDDWLRTQISNRALARAASKGHLLLHRPTRPYVSVRLQRQVRKATSSDPAKRFQSASDFVASLQQLALPNWQPGTTPVAFSTAKWQSWDWQVQATPNAVSILRARPGSGCYRRWRSAVDLESAARMVEDFRP